MKKILTIIAVLFTLNCSASTIRVNYDTTLVKCCEKHRTQYISGDVVLSKEEWQVKAKKCVKKRLFRKLLIMCELIMYELSMYYLLMYQLK
jgi:hypothetical protein